MANSWKKYLDVFKNADKIAEGISNTLFKKEHVEAVATDRFQICIKCSLFGFLILLFNTSPPIH